MARPDKLILTTPKGAFLFPRLQEPEDPFEEGKPEYNCSIIIPKHEAADFLERLETAFAENIAEQQSYQTSLLPAPKPGKKQAVLELTGFKTKPWEDEVDDEGNPTGNIIFKAKRPSVIKRKDKKDITLRVALFDHRGWPFWTEKVGEKDGKPVYAPKKDADGNPEKVPAIGNGTIGKLNVEVRGFYWAPDKSAGIRLDLRGAQVISLVEFGGGDVTAEGMGFSAEDAPALDSAEGDEAGGDESGESADF